MTTTNEHVRNTLAFSKYVNQMKTKRKHDWRTLGNLFTRVLNQLYSSPACQTYFDDSFAYLSSDIIHDVVNLVDYRVELQDLVKVQNQWGAWAIERSAYFDQFDPKFADTSLWLSCDSVYETRWKKFLQKAPRLHGKLILDSLCDFVGSGEELYSALKPNFHDLTLIYNIREERSKHEYLSAFLAKQLEYPPLRRVSLCVNADFRLDNELFTFCLSDNFEYLDWDCPLSIDFFVRVYNAFKAHGSVPADRKRRQVIGFFDRSAVKEIAETLRLKRTNNSDGTIDWSREDRCAEFKDCLVSICVVSGDRARVDVTIELKRIDSTKVETDEADGEDEEEEVNDDFGPIEEDNYWFDRRGCEERCKLQSEMNQYDWTEEDCEDCTGCEFCEPGFDSRCGDCGEEHYCNPHDC